MADDSYDCIIVGAGPAGLNAALILARCRRRLLLCDDGQPRNATSRGLHGFLSRDGTPPLELLQMGRHELRKYEHVDFRHTSVIDARRTERTVEVTMADGSLGTGRMLLLATGVADELPPLDGIAELYGRSVFHCPYCDGWEHRDQPLAVYGRGKSGAGLSMTVSLFTDDLVLCTDGRPRLDQRDRARLERRNVRVVTQPIRKLAGEAGILREIVFTDGSSLPRRAMFVHTQQRQHSNLAERLGCRINARRSIETGKYEVSSVPGVYVAGDASRDVQLAIVAAAEGARAAFAINKALLQQEIAAGIARDSAVSTAR